MKNLTIAICLCLLLGCGKNRSGSAQEKQEEEQMVPWGDEMITRKESALRRIGDPLIAADLVKDMAKTDPVILADYERYLRLADEAKTEARKLGATEGEILKFEKEFWPTMEHELGDKKK